MKELIFDKKDKSVVVKAKNVKKVVKYESVESLEKVSACKSMDKSVIKGDKKCHDDGQRVDKMDKSVVVKVKMLKM